MALERFVFFPVEKRNQVIRRDGPFNRHRWFTPWGLRGLRIANVAQRCMDRTYKRRKIAGRNRVVTHISANDVGREVDHIGAGCWHVFGGARMLLIVWESRTAEAMLHVALQPASVSCKYSDLPSSHACFGSPPSGRRADIPADPPRAERSAPPSRFKDRRLLAGTAVGTPSRGS